MSRRIRIQASCAALLAIHGAVLLSGFLAPYHFSRQHREYPYAQPMALHFIDGQGRFHLRPFVYGLRLDIESGELREDRSRTFPIRFFVPAAADEKSGAFRRQFFGVQDPGVVFLLGSDGLGRDLFSRVLYGGQVSLFTGVMAGLVSLLLGTALGTVAGFFGGWPDQIFMRGGELVMALPWLYLLLAIRAFLPLHISTIQAFFLLVAVIGGVGWVRPARLIRGVALSAKERDYVHAARGFGAGPIYLIRRHVLPQTLPVALTQATVLIPQYILAEVTLSFLGLGVGEPVPSWGNLLTEARQFFALTQHPWMLAPGVAVILVLLAYIVLADAFGEEWRNVG